MLDTLIKTPLAVINTIADIMKKTNDLTKSGGSLNEYTKALRVEPLVLIDQSVESLPYTEDILKTCLTMFSAYYLQAIAISVNVGKVDVARMFDHLNPERGMSGGWTMEGISLVNPDIYQSGLPKINFTSLGNEGISNNDVEKIKKVADFVVSGKSVKDNVDVKYDEVENKLEFSVPGIKDNPDGRDGLTELNNKNFSSTRVDKKGYEVLEKPDLIVGNILDVQIESNGHRATIPITVRLLPSVIRSDVLVHILSKNERDLGIQERYHELMAGQIKFWKDLVLCQDLIDEHKATLMKDKSGQYQEILKRRQKNRAAAYRTGRQSVADASNIVIMSTASSAKFEAACGGRLKDFRVRQRVFEETYLMLMVVIDPEWEQATIYHRGIALPTNVSVKAMKQNNKKGGVDVGEILKAYQLGNNPSL